MGNKPAVTEGHPLDAAIRYFNTGVEAVPGFLLPGAAAGILSVLELQQRDGIAGPIAEIGTYLGKTFIGLGLALRPGEHIIGLDIFVHRGWDFEATLRANCAAHGLDETRMRLHRGASTKLGVAAWAELLGAPARFVHVDGDHTRASALHDLSLAATALAEGGAILVDDVLHAWYPDVTVAVLDFLRGHPELRAVALFDRQGSLTRGGPKLLLVREEDQARYESALRETMGASGVGEATLLDSRPLVFSFEDGVVKAPLRLG